MPSKHPGKSDDAKTAKAPWEDTYQRLSLIAARMVSRWTYRMPQLDAQDLVQETLLRYLCSPDGLGWDRERLLLAFLTGVMRNILSERIRQIRRMNIKGSLSEATFAEANASDRALQHDPTAEYELSSTIALVRAEAAKDPELNELVEAADQVVDIQKHNRVQQISKILDVTCQQVRTREKRLKRKLNGLL